MIAAPVLIVSTTATAFAFTGAGSEGGGPPKTSANKGLEATLSSRAALDITVSRSEAGGRAPLDDVDRTDPLSVDTKRMFTTTSLNVWSGPGERFKRRTVLGPGAKVASTGIDIGTWTQIVYKGRFAWVKADFVARHKPEVAEDTVETKNNDSRAVSGSVTEAPCPRGSSVEAGLTADAIRVYRSVCAQFPEVTSYGGVRPDSGEHGTGQALDIMSTGALGDAIAAYVRANASKLGVSEVLWAQQIWTVERGGEGWRGFSDRGSATANHFDHVHVTVYGNSGH